MLLRNTLLLGLLLAIAVFACGGAGVAFAEDEVQPSQAGPDADTADDETPDQTPPDEEPVPVEPIVSANGLELIDWYTTDGHQLHLVFHDQGTVRGGRHGTISYVATLESGHEIKGTKRFSCSPHDNYNTDKVLASYKPRLSEQWANVQVTFDDNKGVSEFWFEVYLY